MIRRLRSALAPGFKEEVHQHPDQEADACKDGGGQQIQSKLGSLHDACTSVSIAAEPAQGLHKKSIKIS
jgi:hypothetical protein